MIFTPPGPASAPHEPHRHHRSPPPLATGTSAAAPFLAGLVALADQLTGRHLGFVNPASYSIARGPDYHAAFHDITAGNDTFVFPPATVTGYSAGPGWDPVTGWGTPDAAVLVPLLARS